MTKQSPFLFACLLYLTACQRNDKNTPIAAVSIAQNISSDTTFRQPAEYEPTESVWLLWSLYDHKSGFSNAQATLDIIQALVSQVHVKLVVPNDSIRQVAIKQIPADLLELNKISLLTLPYNEFWTRDMGPVFLKKNHQKWMGDFSFNGWGTGTESDPLNVENEKLDEQIAQKLQIPIVSSTVISEGGDRELNRLGVLITSEVVELGRNPGKTKQDLEAEYKRLLGVKKVIWLKEGLHEDDHTHRGPILGPGNKPVYTVLTTNGHVDEYVRFVNDSTILLAEVDSFSLKNDPISRENARRLAENYQILKQAVNTDGRPFRIVRMPLPHNIIGTMKPGDGVYDLISAFDYTGGHNFPKGKPVQAIAAASYLNFLIANQVVLVPKYWKPGAPESFKTRDEAAFAVFRSVFPDKTIVPLDVLSVNWGGGGIHCITMNEPH